MARNDFSPLLGAATIAVCGKIILLYYPEIHVGKNYSNISRLEGIDAPEMADVFCLTDDSGDD